ncbi:MAG: hypothetical protein J7500_16150 [Sphingomonas sp.]|uniref:hypothetical protein n=1 Tax=Sphingomonas sp. TaxID=28214 RepID=UPI001B0F024B|nr:hypothetical protein [Sphingomonas sp.]MBO9624242.1 hypothetical protein [Sphingomonas sp.]
MKRESIAAMGAALLIGGCGGTTVPEVRPAAHVPVPTATTAVPPSIAAVKGQTARHLVAQFGKPQLDITEGNARKLQFGGPICVLDAYLYPPEHGEAVVTHIDTRQRDGRPIDPASCLAALTLRAAAP